MDGSTQLDGQIDPHIPGSFSRQPSPGQGAGGGFARAGVCSGGPDGEFGLQSLRTRGATPAPGP